MLIDCPAGIEKGFTNAVVGADEAIVVCTPEVSAVRDVDRVVGLLGNRSGRSSSSTACVRCSCKRARCFRSRTSTRFCGLPLLGVIADEPDVIISTNRGEPLALRAIRKPVRHIRAIAARVAGEDVPRRPSSTQRLHGNGFALRRPPLMIDFFNRLFGHSKSSTTAKERLRLVLLSDHLSLAPEMVDAIKRELVDVISRYVEVDREKIEVNVRTAGQSGRDDGQHSDPVGHPTNGQAAPSAPAVAAPTDPQAAATLSPRRLLRRRRHRHRRNPSTPAAPAKKAKAAQAIAAVAETAPA